MSEEVFSNYLGATWRLEYSGAARGVWWRQLANFHARISDTYRDRATGELVYRINGRGAGPAGRSFSLDIDSRRFHNHRAFTKAIGSVAGAGACIWVNCGAAFRRSIIANSGAAIQQAVGAAGVLR